MQVIISDIETLKEYFLCVCYDPETTVLAIKKCISNSYTIEPLYRQRRKKYFDFIDQNNCDRLFRAIKNQINTR